MNTNSLNSKLAALCVDVNFVRSARIDLTVLIENYIEVCAVLAAYGYCITDDDCKGELIAIRAV